MKKVLAFLFTGLLFGVSMAQKDPVIMRVADKNVTKSEFLQIYLKNNPNPRYDQEALDEYMELFKKFKLKVLEAEKLGYDTIPKLMRELEGYRKQLALPYLVDSAKNQALVREGYERLKEEVKASHILIRVDENAAPQDTLKAYNKILELRKRILKGEDFAHVARGKGGSEDPSVKDNGGDLGYFSAFQMVYPFEDAAYKTKVGEVSPIVRTKFGYHILKVTDRRPARGLISTSHIMIMVQRTSTDEQKENAEQRIREIYDRLQSGENFEELARKYSEDQTSRNKGGELPEFGTGSRQRMVPEFEDVAFALSQDGNFSEPFQTAYGWHIVKRNSLKGLEPFEALKKEIQQKVNRDERSLKTQASFIEKLKKDYKFKDFASKQLNWFYTNVDSTFYDGEWKAKQSKDNPIMFQFSDVKFYRADFASYLENQGAKGSRGPLKQLIDAAYKTYTKEQLLAYEEAQLETKYADFRALMNEYHDGVLLYEIMNDKVWNKAIRDTSGLKEFFEANREEFKWKERIDADIYECDSKEIALKVTDLLKNDTISPAAVASKINEKSSLNVKTRSGKYEIDNTAYLKGHTFKNGVNPIIEFEGKAYVVKVKNMLPATQKELTETKGAVTAAYQQYLEASWLDELAKKYPITVEKEVLYNIGKK
jgi:peptidyl-prolyl cis-trans isomerase SurA